MDKKDKTTLIGNLPGFGLDPKDEGADVPSVTKLLNRKKVTSRQITSPEPMGGSAPPLSVSPVPLPEPLSEATNGIQISEDTSVNLEIETRVWDRNLKEPEQEPSGAIPVSALKVQPTRRKKDPGADSSKALLKWDPATLAHGPDPMGQALAELLQKGATQVLFLAILANPGGTTPLFAARAEIEASQKMAVWTGLTWNPTVVPELWNQFIKNAMVELAPPGTTTNIQSNRNIVRLAFGVEADEWIVLVRAGAANSCRGVVAILSKKSISPHIQSLLSQFAAQISIKVA